MFVVLNVVSTGKRKIKNGKTIKKIHECSMGAGQRFFVLDVLDSSHGINWDDIAVFTGKHSSRLLMDRSIVLPSDAPVKRFEPVKFRNVLIYNTVSMVIKELFLSGIRVKCCVHDPTGDYAYLLSSVVRYAAETVVVTSDEYRYFSFARVLYDELGAGVTITDTPPMIQQNDLIIDTCGTFGYSGKGVLFSGDSAVMPGAVEGFEMLASFCPDYIDRTDFLAAAFEMNREKRLSHAYCRTFFDYGTEKTVSGLTDELKLRMGILSNRRKSVIFYV